MSFDIFVVGIRGGENIAFDRAIVERVFRPLIDYQGQHGWGLKLPDWGPCSGFVYIDDEPQITNFSVNRPPFVPAFLDALFEVLCLTPTILVWPDAPPNPSACIANLEVFANLSPELRASFCNPPLVSSGAEIDACVSGKA